MEVVFKDDKYFYYISDYNTINRGLIANLSEHKDFSMVRGFSDIDFSNIPHLDDAEVLYHYRDKNSGEIYTIYYEHNGTIITETSSQLYFTTIIHENLIKDYTLVNLKLLQDGSNI